MTNTNQKLIVNPWALKQFHYTKTVPCFHIDPQNVTTTSMILESPQELKETDRFISTEECLEILSTRVPGFDDSFFASKEYLDIKNSDPHGFTLVPKDNTVLYKDLVIKYKDFPGNKDPILELFDVHLRLKLKINTHISKIYPVDRNFCIYIRYLNPEQYPWLESTGGMIQSKIMPNNPKIADNLIPSLVCKINKNTLPDLHNTSDFAIIASQPGYYCNLPLQEIATAEFFESDFNGIVVDPEVRKPLMDAITERLGTISADEKEQITKTFVENLSANT